MNKREAKVKSQAGELSIGELRAMISLARGQVRPSRVNPSLMLTQVCDILERAFEGRPDDERPRGLKSDPYSDRMKPTKDSLIIANILRECA